MIVRSDTHWLPPLPDPDAAFAALRAIEDPAVRLAQITKLASHRLDFVHVTKLDRTLSRTLGALGGQHGLPSVKVAWLGSSTLDHVLPATRIAALRAGLFVEQYLGGYGQYRQEIHDPASGLARFAPDVVILVLDHTDVGIDVPVAAPAADIEAAVERRVDELRLLWKTAAERLGCTVVQQTIPPFVPTLFGSFDAIVPGSPVAVIDALDRAIVRAAEATRTAVLDIAAWASRGGFDRWFDPVRWFQAKQLVSPNVTPLYGDLVARKLAALRGRSRKCLVLDLDNTLWGGVVGDDGVERLVLGQGSASGEAYTAFQQYVRRLKERGVVLAVCSKNEKTIAQSAFSLHPEMVLKLDDFGAFFANWKDKASNLRQIAEALNLGLDSFVFFDDNPAERAVVRAELPSVAVLEVPEDPAYYVWCLADAGYFEAVSFTADDLSRAKQYQDNGRRLEELSAATDMDSFLRGLEMKLVVGSLDEHSLVRVTQLVNKTNQFNVTTRRYTEPQMRAFAADAASFVLHFRLTDRFGDNGLIAVALARGVDARRLAIDTFLMSCRVLGRGVEQAIMNTIVDEAQRRGFEEVLGEYIPTAKNGMVRDLYERLGFARTGEEPGTGATQWSARVREYVRHLTFIDVGARP